jgi:hypothetical protein
LGLGLCLSLYLYLYLYLSTRAILAQEAFDAVDAVVESKQPLDLVWLASEARTAICCTNMLHDLYVQGYEYFVEQLAIKHPETQYVVVSSSAQLGAPNIVNVNRAWATLYEARLNVTVLLAASTLIVMRLKLDRYLAGIVAGGMISTNGTVCYILSFRTAQVLRYMLSPEQCVSNAI